MDGSASAADADLFWRVQAPMTAEGANLSTGMDSTMATAKAAVSGDAATQPWRSAALVTAPWTRGLIRWMVKRRYCEVQPVGTASETDRTPQCSASSPLGASALLVALAAPTPLRAAKRTAAATTPRRRPQLRGVCGAATRRRGSSGTLCWLTRRRRQMPCLDHQQRAVGITNRPRVAGSCGQIVRRRWAW